MSLRCMRRPRSVTTPSPRSKVFNSEMSSRVEEKLQIPLGAAEDKRPCRWLQGVRAALRSYYGGGETQVKSKGMIAWPDKFESNLPRILGPPQQRRATGQGIMFGYDEPGKTTPRTHSMAPRLTCARMVTSGGCGSTVRSK